jgi:hypothetical protein
MGPDLLLRPIIEASAQQIIAHSSKILQSCNDQFAK